MVPVDEEFAETLAALMPEEEQKPAGQTAAWRVFAAALAHADTRRIQSLKVNLTRRSRLFTLMVGPITGLSILRSLHLSFSYRMSGNGAVRSGLDGSSIPSFTQLFRESRLREICLHSAGIDPFHPSWRDPGAEEVDAFAAAVADNTTLEKLWLVGFDSEVDPGLAVRLQQSWTANGRSPDGFRYSKDDRY